MKLQKHLSEDSLKSVNGECVNVPVDQYKKLLNAQQVSSRGLSFPCSRRREEKFRIAKQPCIYHTENIFFVT